MDVASAVSTFVMRSTSFVKWSWPLESTTSVQIFVEVNVTLLDERGKGVSRTPRVNWLEQHFSRNKKRSAPIRTIFSSDVFISPLEHGRHPDDKIIQNKSLRMFTSHFIRKCRGTAGNTAPAGSFLVPALLCSSDLLAQEFSSSTFALSLHDLTVV